MFSWPANCFPFHIHERPSSARFSGLTTRWRRASTYGSGAPGVRPRDRRAVASAKLPRFPRGHYGIPFLSYYDNSPYLPSGHPNSCIAAQAHGNTPWGGETLNSRIANDEPPNPVEGVRRVGHALHEPRLHVAAATSRQCGSPEGRAKNAPNRSSGMSTARMGTANRQISLSAHLSRRKTRPMTIRFFLPRRASVLLLPVLPALVGTTLRALALALVATATALPDPLAGQTPEEAYMSSKRSEREAAEREAWLPLWGHSYAGDLKRGLLPNAVRVGGVTLLVISEITKEETCFREEIFFVSIGKKCVFEYDIQPEIGFFGVVRRHRVERDLGLGHRPRPQPRIARVAGSGGCGLRRAIEPAAPDRVRRRGAPAVAPVDRIQSLIRAPSARNASTHRQAIQGRAA